jgi:hypothetical protein
MLQQVKTLWCTLLTLYRTLELSNYQYRTCTKSSKTWMDRVYRSLWRTSLTRSGLYCKLTQVNYLLKTRCLIQILLLSSACALFKFVLLYLSEVSILLILSTLQTLYLKACHLKWLPEIRAGLMITPGYLLVVTQKMKTFRIINKSKVDWSLTLKPLKLWRKQESLLSNCQKNQLLVLNLENARVDKELIIWKKWDSVKKWLLKKQKTAKLTLKMKLKSTLKRLSEKLKESNRA